MELLNGLVVINNLDLLTLKLLVQEHIRSAMMEVV
jgi:hypothetical protein